MVTREEAIQAAARVLEGIYIRIATDRALAEAHAPVDAAQDAA